MKTCDQCKQPYGRRKAEAHWQYAERRFCSRACADKGRRTTRVPDSEFKARYRQKKRPDGTRTMYHRWVVEQHLGRKLETWEQVHHINHDRPDHHIAEGCTGLIGATDRCPCRHSAESAAQAAHPDQLSLTSLLEGDPS